MLDAITFDLWSTLIEPVDYSGPRIDYLLETLALKGYCIERDAAKSAYSFSLDRFCDVWQNKHRHMPSEQRVEMMLKKLEIILAAEEIRIMTKDLEEIVLKDPPPLISDTELVLNSLFETYKIGLICDSGMSPGKVMREILAAYDLLQYFDSMVFSDELGVTKPDSRAYQTALDQMGVDAQKAMHVGDLLATDVAGARSVGMKSVWLNREGVRRVNRTVAPDYEIHRLAELLDIVRKETSV